MKSLTLIDMNLVFKYYITVEMLFVVYIVISKSLYRCDIAIDRVFVFDTMTMYIKLTLPINQWNFLQISVIQSHYSIDTCIQETIVDKVN